MIRYRLRLPWYWMVCLGNEERSYCHFWDCIKVLHFRLFYCLWGVLHLFLGILAHSSNQLSSVQSLSHVWLFVTPWTAACQASLSFTILQSSPKVGSQEIPGVTGKFDLGVQNEAGQRLTEFCQENALVIGNTIFQQHKRQLYTWTSPDGQYRNQTDYILFSQRWRSSIQSA